jgi:predicted porin
MNTNTYVQAFRRMQTTRPRRSLLPLAALTLSSAAAAQSTVTMFGVIDTGVQVVRNSGGGSVTRLNNSGMNVSSSARSARWASAARR